MSNDPTIAAAMATFTKAIDDSQARGFANGYATAREHLLGRFRVFLDQIQSETTDDLVSAQLKHVDDFIQAGTAFPVATTIGRAPRSGSDQDRVLTSVRNHPGKRGVDLVHVLAKQVEERTVRTALHRLKMRGLIAKHGDGWYTAEEFEKIEGQPVRAG